MTWENHFKPGRLEPYLAIQTKLSKTLASIQKQKSVLDSLKDGFCKMTRTLVNEYAHQSVAIEQNSLKISDTRMIEEKLDESLRHLDLPQVDLKDLSRLQLPTPNEMFPSYDESEVAELRNHILISRYLFEVALANRRTPGVPAESLRPLSQIMLKGTLSERSYSLGWGKRIALGDFRSLCIGVRSDPLRIFPYPEEVPACIERFFKWRDSTHAGGQLHPLIFATQLHVYFESIHPFPDGNGRLGRCLMADHLIRQGYLPIVFVDLNRDEHVKMVGLAEDGKPEELCTHVAQTQLDMLFEMVMRDREP